MTVAHLEPYLGLDGICRNPVFVIGSPRSGTTAMGHALNAHPGLWGSKECYVLHQLFGNRAASRSWEDHRDRANPSWLREENVERKEFLAFLGMGLNAMYSSRAGGRRWVDATPLNTLMADEIAEMFPGAQFVVLLRDGRSVVRSMLGFRKMVETAHGGPVPDAEMPAWTVSFERACRTWAQYTTSALDLQEKRSRRCIVVRNEQLGERPGPELGRLLAFLGLPDHPGPTEVFAGPRINSSFGNDASPDASWSGLDAEQRETFARFAGEAMDRAGYRR